MDDLELFQNPAAAAKDKEHSKSSDDSNSDESGDSAQDDSEDINSDSDRQNKIINPLALKPVFVSKLDREMLEPCI